MRGAGPGLCSRSVGYQDRCDDERRRLRPRWQWAVVTAAVLLSVLAWALRAAVLAGLLWVVFQLAG